MASILSVEQLRGLSSGDNPNTITLPTGQTLDFSAGTLTMPAGHVIQTVSYNDIITATNTNSTSFVATTLAATITPTSTSSKILVTATFSATQDGGSNYQSHVQIYRGTTNLRPFG